MSELEASEFGPKELPTIAVELEAGVLELDAIVSGHETLATAVRYKCSWSGNSCASNEKQVVELHFAFDEASQ